MFATVREKQGIKMDFRNEEVLGKTIDCISTRPQTASSPAAMRLLGAGFIGWRLSNDYGMK